MIDQAAVDEMSPDDIGALVHGASQLTAEDLIDMGDRLKKAADVARQARADKRAKPTDRLAAGSFIIKVSEVRRVYAKILQEMKDQEAVMVGELGDDAVSRVLGYTMNP